MINKLKNKEFRLSLTNMLALEEHLIELLFKATSKNEKKELFLKLQKNKSLRNSLLSNNIESNERTIDFNKWCSIKHLLLSQYHLFETINQTSMTFEEAEIYIATSKELEHMIESVIDQKITGECPVCKNDLLIHKFFKNKKNKE